MRLLKNGMEKAYIRISTHLQVLVWWFYNHKRIIIVSADEKILKILLF